ncbi:MAG: hypothetical protein ABL926_00350 [Novosphingobium sp.]|uniref:hypothetical protein n=1 Tax=Novosphingobium sp. TaxID=1874826 RepID=UPI0032B701E4
MIAIGNDFGGPELRGSSIHTALNTAMKIAAAKRDEHYNDGSEPWVNPIFLVPGSILKPDFEGFKIGHFSKKEKGLVVQIVVPQSVADGEGISEFVGRSLRHAVRLAADFFALKGISFPALKAEKIIMEIEAGLRPVVA